MTNHVTLLTICLIWMFFLITSGNSEKFLARNYSTLQKKHRSKEPTVFKDVSFEDFRDQVKKKNLEDVFVSEHPNWKIFGNECGVSLDAENRIVGGKNAQLGQHPWIARLGRYKTHRGGARPTVDWYCGATLISKYYLVSAAHCSQLNQLRVIRLGEYDSKLAIDCLPDGTCAAAPQDRRPSKVINHINFSSERVTTSDDISLILLSKPANLNEWVKPICLPRFYSPNFDRGAAIAIGWGLTKTDPRTYPTILQTIRLPIINETACNKIYDTARGTFCAGGVKTEDSCNGDSGGPLLKLDDTMGSAKYYLIGVTSFGPRVCGNGEPGAYTNVTSHIPWILDNVNKNYH